MFNQANSIQFFHDSTFGLTKFKKKIEFYLYHNFFWNWLYLKNSKKKKKMYNLRIINEHVQVYVPRYKICLTKVFVTSIYYVFLT